MYNRFQPALPNNNKVNNNAPVMTRAMMSTMISITPSSFKYPQIVSMAHQHQYAAQYIPGEAGRPPKRQRCQYHYNRHLPRSPPVSAPTRAPANKANNKATATKSKKQVRFSASASLRVYELNPSYASSKSYTKVDYRSFSKETCADVVRIKNALESLPPLPIPIEKCSCGSSSSSSSSPSSSYTEEESTRQQRLQACNILPEQILGIEHLVFESSPSILVKARKLHVRAIMVEQENQRILRVKNQDRLSRLSILSGRRSQRMAKVRAAMAA